MLVYSSLLLLVLVLGAPFWLVRMITSGRYRAGLSGRLGRIPKELRAAVAGRNVIWIHAVSVGELLAATQLIRELTTVLPDWAIAVSTTTETGQRLARERLPDSPVFYLPLDFAFVVRRYLRVLRPRLLVLMESELWPRLIAECAYSGVPVAVVNARISDRSFPRYLRLRHLWRPLLAKISLYLAQSGETAERLKKIGAPSERVRVMGNLKYDIRVARETPLTAMLRDRLPAGSPVLVCGSTLEGEEHVLLEAWPAVLAAAPGSVMVLAPRHPDRFQAVSELVQASGLELARASAFRERPVAVASGSIFLLDTIGDLAGIYSLAAVAFVGGSLFGTGGHNPLEPAQFAVPVVMGPSFQNFREIVETMRSADAIRIAPAGLVAAELVRLLQDRAAAQALGQRANRVFQAQSGATKQMVEALMELLTEPGVSGR